MTESDAEMNLAMTAEDERQRTGAKETAGGDGHGRPVAPNRRPFLATGALSAQDFARFSQLIQTSCGIKMPPQKKSMMEARLRKRLRALGLADFEEYAEYLFGEEGRREELIHFIDVMTTNKTDFFREPKHFDFLRQVVLPQLVESRGAGVDRPLRIWSAGCSTGEEPYTLAMVLAEFAARVPGFDFTVLATDISSQVLETARTAIYRREKIEAVPDGLKKKYLLRSRDPEKPLIRVGPELRSKVEFRQLNFMEEEFAVGDPVDIIFFRNVMIYFNRQNQVQLLHRFCRLLPKGRFLFTGHSETLHGMNLPVTQVAPAVYCRE